MKTLLVTTGLAALMATAATAGTISYNTTGSTLSCGAAAGCVQNTSTSVTLGGLTFTYNAGLGSNVVTPSIINLGNIVTTGSGSMTSAAGLQLSININSTPPGGNGAIPNGLISGTISTNASTAIITFSPNNTTTGFGTLPGVNIGGVATYQVLNTSLGLQAPTVGNPLGQTTIQGTVTSTTPEPGSMLLLSSGLIGVYLTRKKVAR